MSHTPGGNEMADNLLDRKPYRDQSETRYWFGDRAFTARQVQAMGKRDKAACMAACLPSTWNNGCSDAGPWLGLLDRVYMEGYGRA